MSRPTSGGASPVRLAAWERRQFAAFRQRAWRSTPFDDELPDDLFADVDETLAAIARARHLAALGLS